MKILSNKFFLLGNLLLLLIAIPVTLYFVKQQQEVRSQAAPSSKLTIEPETSTTSTQCTDHQVDLMVDPGSNIVSIVDFYITYDATKLELKEIIPSTSFATTVRAVSISAGQANMSVSVGADVTKAVSTKSKVATITFTPKSTGAAQVTIDSTQSRVFSLGPADQPTENVLSSVSPGTINIGSEACATSTSPTPSGGATSPTPSGAAASPTPTGIGGNPSPTTAVSPTSAQNQSPVCTSLTGTPTSGAAPLSVLFTGNGNDPDTTGTITGATFTFGDGQTQQVQTGLGQKTASTQVSHTYTTAGNFSATLVFTDNVQATSTSCTQNISVSAAQASVSATPTTAIAPTTPPTATPTLVVKATFEPTAAPTIVPTGSITQTFGLIGIVLLTLIGGFVFLTL